MKEKEENIERVGDWIMGKMIQSKIDLNIVENKIKLADDIFKFLKKNNLLTGKDF